MFLLRAPARHKNYPTDTRDVSETMSVEGSKHTHEPPLPLHRSSQFIGQNRFGDSKFGDSLNLSSIFEKNNQ